MKVFGWMQCMLRNKSAALIKDSEHVSGNTSCLLLNNPSWNNQQDNLWPKNGRRCTRKPQNDHFERYLSECKLDEATQATFPGFLTIGTLNMDSISSTEPATPTFGFPPDEEAKEGHPMEKMNYDLKLVNHELEKFLKAEGENEGLNYESRRTSVASTITLSGKDKEMDDNEANIAFPLQGYLFASSYDLPDSEEESMKERMSLLELFRRSGEVDKNSCIKLDIIEEDQAIRKLKAPMHPMRRILQTFQPSLKKNKILRDGGVLTKSSPTSKRFCKIKKLFQRKVHPESLVVAKESNIFCKCKKDKTRPNNGNRNIINEGFMVSGNESCKSSSLKNGTNGEHWIKTDEDYLVLELGQK